jgi:serralysin
VQFDDQVANTSETLELVQQTTSFVATEHDQDYFRVELVAGRSYILDARGSFTLVGNGIESLVDPTLALRGADGGVLAFDDNGGPDLAARVEFTACSTGTFFLDVGGAGAAIGAYELRGREDDVADDESTRDVLAVGGSVGGTVGRTDIGETAIRLDNDLFRTELVAGQTYAFRLVAPGSDRARFELTGPGIGGSRLISQGEDVTRAFTPTGSGTFFADVSLQTFSGDPNPLVLPFNYTLFLTVLTTAISAVSEADPVW